jgi:hypothetical protein
MRNIETVFLAKLKTTAESEEPPTHIDVLINYTYRVFEFF